MRGRQLEPSAISLAQTDTNLTETPMNCIVGRKGYGRDRYHTAERVSG